jgi:HEAT repeat protein
MKEALQKAIEQLKTAEPADVWEAAKLLAREKAPEAAGPLIDLLRDSAHVERRIAAAWALGLMNAQAAVPCLVRILEDTSEPPRLRDHAAEALGNLGNAAARPAVITNLADENLDVVYSCAFALRTIGTLDDVLHLARLAASPHLRSSGGWSVAEEAAEAIQAIKKRSER